MLLKQSDPPSPPRDYRGIYWNARHVSNWYVFRGSIQHRTNIDMVAIR
jgi:hypothetical protein